MNLRVLFLHVRIVPVQESLQSTNGLVESWLAEGLRARERAPIPGISATFMQLAVDIAQRALPAPLHQWTCALE